MGKWLGEEYRVVDQHVEDDEDGAPGVPGDGNTEEH